jgi:hypothetical protein
MYLDGGAVYEAPAIHFPTPAGPAKFRLSYNNKPTDGGAIVNEGFGPGWGTNIPHLEFRSDGQDPEGKLYLVVDAVRTFEFLKESTNEWHGIRGVVAKILRDAAKLRVMGSNGGTLDFPLNNRTPIGLGVSKITDPYGQEWEYHYFTSGAYTGRIDYFVDPVGRVWTFYWYTLQEIVPRVYGLKVEYGAEPNNDLTYVSFSYYSTTVAGVGRAGDLEKIVISDKRSTSRPTRTAYYRYYTQTKTTGDREDRGYPGDLRYVIEPQNYARFSQFATANNKGPNAVTDTEIETNGFFNLKFGYDPGHRVIGEVVAPGCGCASSSSGYRTYEYLDYTTQDPGSDYSDWATAVKRLNPDGSCYFVEVNKAGAITTLVHQEDADNNSSPRRAMVYQYDTNGRVVQVWHPSACDPSGYSFPSSDTDYVEPSGSGAIELFEYYNWTVANVGAENLGQIKTHKIKNGTAGTPIKLYEVFFDYTDSGGVGIWANGGYLRPQKIWKYVSDNGNDYEETQFSYTYHNGDYDKLATKTITLPTATKPESVARKIRKSYSSSTGLLPRRQL